MLRSAPTPSFALCATIHVIMNATINVIMNVMINIIKNVTTDVMMNVMIAAFNMLYARIYVCI